MIYSVEDDAAIRELIVYALRQAGYEAEGFEEGGAFRQALERKTPELVLLDLMLPGEDGLSLLRFLRQNPATRETPVILLTARGTEMDKVVGLDTGADDYVVKPSGSWSCSAGEGRAAPLPQAGGHPRAHRRQCHPGSQPPPGHRGRGEHHAHPQGV